MVFFISIITYSSKKLITPCFHAAKLSTERDLSHLTPFFNKIAVLHEIAPWTKPKVGDAENDLFKRGFGKAMEIAALVMRQPQEPLSPSELNEKESLNNRISLLASGTVEQAFTTWTLQYDTEKEENTPSLFTANSKNRYSYSLKEGNPPIDGLLNFVKGPTTTDCGGAVEAVFFKMIAEFIGPEKFNAIFSHPTLKLRFESQGESLLPLFTKYAHAQFDSSSRSYIKPGMSVYFQGIPWYAIKHPIGFHHGLHAVCSGYSEMEEPLYWGLGLRRPLSEVKICSMLLDHYNHPRSTEDINFIQNELAKISKNAIDNCKSPPSEQEKQAIQSKSEAVFKYLLEDIHSNKLQGRKKEVEECYENPDKPYTLEMVKDAGFGFYGPISVKELSLPILKLIQTVPLEAIKSPEFPETLTLTQAVGTLVQALKHDKTNASEIGLIENRETDNFHRWMGSGKYKK